MSAFLVTLGAICAPTFNRRTERNPLERRRRERFLHPQYLKKKYTRLHRSYKTFPPLSQDVTPACSNTEKNQFQKQKHVSNKSTLPLFFFTTDSPLEVFQHHRPMNQRTRGYEGGFVRLIWLPSLIPFWLLPSKVCKCFDAEEQVGLVFVGHRVLIHRRRKRQHLAKHSCGGLTFEMFESHAQQFWHFTVFFPLNSLNSSAECPIFFPSKSHSTCLMMLSHSAPMIYRTSLWSEIFTLNLMHHFECKRLSGLWRFLHRRGSRRWQREEKTARLLKNNGKNSDVMLANLHHLLLFKAVCT